VVHSNISEELHWAIALTFNVCSAEERKRRIAMKSTRNPLSKQLRAVRRTTSDISCPDEDVSTAPDVDMNQESAHASVTEELSASRRVEMPMISSEATVGQSAAEVCGCQSVNDESSKGITSFQLEFLKMLSAQNESTGTLDQSRFKPPKVVGKSDGMHGHKTACRRKSTEKCGSMPSSCSQTNSLQDADVGDVKAVIGSSSSCAETGSLASNDYGIVSPVARLNSKADRTVSAAKPSCVAETSEGAADKTLALEESCSPAQSDTLPPVLSLPDPLLTDVGVHPQRPPVLEPSYVASRSSAATTMWTVSDAISADVSVAGLPCEQSQLVEMSASHGGKLKTDREREAHSIETSTAGPVSSVACSVSDPTMQITSSDTPASLTVSTSATARPQCQVSSGTAVPPPTSARRISSLAQFRPTASAGHLLPLTMCYTCPRPTAPPAPRFQQPDRI